MLFKNKRYFTATSPKLNCATLNAGCGQFHQQFITAFAPSSLRQKKFNPYFKHNKALYETTRNLVVKLTPVEKNRIYDSLEKNVHFICRQSDKRIFFFFNWSFFSLSHQRNRPHCLKKPPVLLQVQMLHFDNQCHMTVVTWEWWCLCRLYRYEENFLECYLKSKQFFILKSIYWCIGVCNLCLSRNNLDVNIWLNLFSCFRWGLRVGFNVKKLILNR